MQGGALALAMQCEPAYHVHPLIKNKEANCIACSMPVEQARQDDIESKFHQLYKNVYKEVGLPVLFKT